jgi:hypothetical protein
MQNGGISFEKPQKVKLEIFDLKNDQGDAAGTTVVFSIPF